MERFERTDTAAAPDAVAEPIADSPDADTDSHADAIDDAVAFAVAVTHAEAESVAVADAARAIAGRGAADRRSATELDRASRRRHVQRNRDYLDQRCEPRSAHRIVLVQRAAHGFRHLRNERAGTARTVLRPPQVDRARYRPQRRRR